MVLSRAFPDADLQLRKNLRSALNEARVVASPTPRGEWGYPSLSLMMGTGQRQLNFEEAMMPSD